MAPRPWHPSGRWTERLPACRVSGNVEVVDRISCPRGVPGAPGPRREDEVTSGRIIRDRISRTDLASMAEGQFGDWIKAVVDVSREVMAVGGDLHADDEAALLADGSRQRDLWGINLHLGETGSDFDSMINLRPSQGNRSLGVDDEVDPGPNPRGGRIPGSAGMSDSL